MNFQRVRGSKTKNIFFLSFFLFFVWNCILFIFKTNSVAKTKIKNLPWEGMDILYPKMDYISHEGEEWGGGGEKQNLVSVAMCGACVT